MAKFVVAFRTRDTAERIAALLRENGHEVFRICTAGDEIRRAFHTIQDGILLSGYRLKDQLLEMIADDLNEHVEILCLGKHDQLEQIELPYIFRQEMPVSRTELTVWADMLVQLHYQRLPHRENSDKELISTAKKQIMAEMNMNESDAHRYMQKISMRLGLRMVQVAERIINHDRV